MGVRGPLTIQRYLGLAGALLLAAGAYRTGARPGAADLDGLPTSADLFAMLCCLAGLAMLTAAWWSIGRTTASARSAVALSGRWMLATAGLWAIPLLLATPLGSRDIYAYACQGAAWQAGLDPHLTAAAGCPWLSSVPALWRHAASPYGPLFGLLSGGAAAVAGGNLTIAVGTLRLIAVAGVLLATWAGRRLAQACGVPAGRAAWLALASPLVLLHAISGAHNDTLVAGFVLAALAAAAGPAVRAATRRANQSGEVRGTVEPGARDQVWLVALVAGAVLGLAVAVKVTAVVALPFLILLLPLDRRSGRQLAVAATAATGGLVGSFAILAGASGLGVGFLRGLTHTGDLVQWTSLPTGVGMTVGYLLRPLGVSGGYPVAVARVLGLLGATAVVVLLWWRAWRTPGPNLVEPAVPSIRPPAVPTIRPAVAAAGWAWAAVALLGPVFYPWYALTPLALLAVSTTSERVRAWLAAGSAVLAWLILPNGTGLAPRTKLPGALLVTAALVAAGTGWLRSRRSRPGAPATPTATGS
ncbi:MAG TPA: polyprenol phosphomannose-dependent alpha 1,6 mannosyltransferase MptB [Micromonosporaceae bacterium]